MAASANPSGNQQEGNGHAFNGGTTTAAVASGGNPSNGNSVTAVENSGRGGGGGGGGAQNLKHNPGLSVEWTPDEQSILDEGLSKYNSESNIIRYAKIAMLLQDKTVRDVALRCRWMTKKENGKRRKDDHALTRKNKDKKEKVVEPSTKSSAHLAARPNAPPYSVPMIPPDNDDGISFKAIGGPTGQMLEQNAQVFNQISANFASYQIQENINLFCQTRDNILTILNELNSDMPGTMKQMPPLPVKMNEELANSILGIAHPRTALPMQ